MSASGSEESFRFVADIVPVLIWMSDADKRCTYVNASWTAFTGRTLEAALREGWRLDPPGRPSRGLEVTTTGFERRQPFTAKSPQRQDGSIGGSSIRPFRGCAGWRVIGYIGTKIDITERKERKNRCAESPSRRGAAARRLAAGNGTRPRAKSSG